MIETRTVFVTGAASGFGREITKKFAQDPKYNPVYAVDKNPQIHGCFPVRTFQRVRTLELDVRDSQKTAEVVDQIIAEKGSIDVLVNNAGIMISGRIPTFFEESGKPTEDLRTMWETNLRAPLELMMRVLPSMREKRSGTIINITSSSPYNRTPHRVVYADYKASLAGSTKIVGQREKPFNIRVVNVEPGMHETALDNWTWTERSDPIDVLAAQALYFWWRRRFAADSENVGKMVYKIAEGEIRDDIVSVGWDSRFARFMSDHFPIWRSIFTNSYKVLHLYNVLLLRGIMKLLDPHDTFLKEIERDSKSVT